MNKYEEEGRLFTGESEEEQVELRDDPSGSAKSGKSQENNQTPVEFDSGQVSPAIPANNRKIEEPKNANSIAGKSLFAALSNKPVEDIKQVSTRSSRSKGSNDKAAEIA